MNSQDLARYIEQTNGAAKPWMWLHLRLLKLQERRHELTESEYMREVTELHTALMNLGEWWVGIEDQVFFPIDHSAQMNDSN